MTDICILNSEVIEVSYKWDEEDPYRGSNTNIFIAAFTTCVAHLKLYESLEKFGDQVLYYNTDSVIYTWKPGQTEVGLGDDLSNMTNKLDNNGKVSLGYTGQQVGWCPQSLSQSNF